MKQFVFSDAIGGGKNATGFSPERLSSVSILPICVIIPSCHVLTRRTADAYIPSTVGTRCLLRLPLHRDVIGFLPTRGSKSRPCTPPSTKTKTCIKSSRQTPPKNSTVELEWEQRLHPNIPRSASLCGSG